jgi:polyvinyl alcohol dehydrogenase (cytochrome)
VVDGVVYVGAWDGVMYALDAATGHKRWTFQTPVAPAATYGPIVSSAAVGDVTVNGVRQRVVVFGAGPRVYALRARDGRLVWKHDASRGKVDTALEYESSPAIVDDLILIGRDTHDENEAATAGARGGLVALHAGTGQVAWSFEPELEQKGVGCGSVWGSPTISPDHTTVFFGSANCPHDEFKWNKYTNAVTALKLRTGTPIWSFQPTGPPDHDTDFGATPNYFVDHYNRPTLGAGKKDGTYYALNPSTGKLRWSRHVQDPVPGIGGFIGSPAVARGNVYGGTAIGRPPYFHSINATTGALRFQGGAGPSYGATAVVNDVVFNAALDDLLKAYSASTGRLLWAAPLSGPGSSGPAIAGDMLFVGAGTSTSDACAKDQFYDAECTFAFDTALASLGGIHAFRLAAPRLSSQTVHTHG